MGTERKEFVKEQRKKFKSDPSQFIVKEIIKPTKEYWKNNTSHALFTFFVWAFIMYALFGGVQAINNDMIYCDSSLDQFDGKLMYTFNDFVTEYNKQADILISDYAHVSQYEKERIATEFFTNTTMLCNYNLTQWNSEPILDRVKTTFYGFKKILLKQS